MIDLNKYKQTKKEFDFGLEKKYTFVNGKIEGKAEEYYESGRLYSGVVFENGESRDHKFYYDEPNPWLVGSVIGFLAFMLGFIASYLLVKYRG